MTHARVSGSVNHCACICVHINFHTMRVCSVRCSICRVISTSVRGIELCPWLHSYFGQDIVHSYLRRTGSYHEYGLCVILATYLTCNLECTHVVAGTTTSCPLPSTYSPLSGSCCPPLVRNVDALCTRSAPLKSPTIVCWTGKRGVPLSFARAVRGERHTLSHEILPRHTVCPFTFAVSSLQQCASRLVL